MKTRPSDQLARPHLFTAMIVLLFLPAAELGAASAASATRSLADLSIEELMNESVTSVSKKVTRFADAPTAISVISADDLRRTGLTTLPEALRMVPGMEVARVNSSIWAISSRGFNGPYANKLLVLMDGRSVYTPLFGGVYWDTQDLILDDLDRIEAIRGPGATLWGANAVNGVVNMISKSAKDTQGTLVSTSVGTEDRPSVSIRYGGAASANLHYRVYAKYFNRDGLVDPQGQATPDDWHGSRAGFRADWQPTASDLVTIQGDYYSSRIGENVKVPRLSPPFSESVNTENPNHGANLLGRWTRSFAESAEFSLQAYVDGFRHEGGETIERRDTADIQLEGRVPLFEGHDFVGGVGYRFTTDDVNNTALVSWLPASRDLHLFTMFFQDEITLSQDRWCLTLGSKFEHNDFTGVEVQPSLRLRWKPATGQTVWAAVSRALSTPSRFYRNARLNTAAFPSGPSGPIIVAALLSNPTSVSEKEDAFEIGTRVEGTNLSLDFTAFYNSYDDINTSVAGPPVFEALPAPPHLLLPLQFQNAVSGETYGGEISAHWKPTEYWRLTANYTLLKMQLAPEDFALKANPRQQSSLRSYLTLPGNVELNGAAFYVGQIDAQLGTTTVVVPHYVRFDLGLVWRPRPNLEVGLWGQNLLDPQHPETTAINTTLRTEVPRTFVSRFTWRF